MKRFFKLFLPIKEAYFIIRDHYFWSKSNYASPAPRQVKKKVMSRYNLPNCTWIETGTYLGDTTLFLSKISSRVISIEPSELLYLKAVKRFRNVSNIELLNKTSEEAFHDVLSKLSGNLCFYLDGHFSGEGTHLSNKETPIELEIKSISSLKKNFDNLVVMIDDFRLFSVDPSYPKREYLVDWAIKNELKWSVQQDIFIASNNNL